MLSATGAAETTADRYAELPGVKLWFTDSGGPGTPVVLLHANTGTTASWEIQNAAFSQAGFRVIAFDRRGWGNSKADAATGTQPGSVAGDLAALADYLTLDRFHLVGVAGGGFAALDYAAWHPERVRSLVVAASTGQFSEKEIEDFRARVQFPDFGKLPVVYREVGPSYRGGNPDGTRRWMAIEEHSQQAGAPAQPLHTPNTYAKMATVTMPTLVLAADADLLAPPALMRVWAAHLSNYEFAIVPDAGHSIAWEQPEIFNDKVLEFIKRH
jgi:pimeloyl-ACP methyl ester carboxylesterase